MPRAETVAIPLAGVELLDTATGQPLSLASLAGVQVLVLMRHRH